MGSPNGISSSYKRFTNLLCIFGIDIKEFASYKNVLKVWRINVKKKRCKVKNEQIESILIIYLFNVILLFF